MLSMQEGRIMLFTYSCFNCRNEKGLLHFVSERIKLVYWINNTRCSVTRFFSHVTFSLLRNIA